MERKRLNRRQFVKQSTAGVLAAGVLNHGFSKRPQAEDRTQSPAVRRYNVLGRTGFRVSDIAFGAPNNETILAAALDAGVNYIDTGEEYSNGGSERTIGRIIGTRDRKSLFINTKLRLEKDVSKHEVLQRARGCLERLNTDYIDCLMIHNATDVNIIACQGFHAAARQLKEEGRIRFIGITSHGNSWWKNDRTLMAEAMEKVCLAAADDGRFDVFLFIYNFLNRAMGERILDVCRRKKIGTSLMKVNPTHNFMLVQEEIKRLTEEGNEERAAYYRERVKESQDMVAQIDTFAKENGLTDARQIKAAAFRFVLKHPDVHTVCCHMPNFEEMENFLALSGRTFSSEDANTLTAYQKGYSRYYCRHACGICEPQCPYGVPVNTIMRYNHYFIAQGREKFAMEKYSRLTTTKPTVCEHCTGYCERICPYGIPIQTLLRLAHRRLSFLG
ncbi:MAG: aldo/keto reductase [Candidatus Aminicenantes bacterium]|nr:MAG: aldo/keto reductase [Candidatus Aminicenantes bacterium]